MADMQCAAAEIRRGKKERTNYSMKMQWSGLFHNKRQDENMKQEHLVVDGVKGSTVVNEDH